MGQAVYVVNTGMEQDTYTGQEMAASAWSGSMAGLRSVHIYCHLFWRNKGTVSFCGVTFCFIERFHQKPLKRFSSSLSLSGSG